MNTDDCSKMSFPNNTEKTFKPTHPFFSLPFWLKLEGAAFRAESLRGNFSGLNGLSRAHFVILLAIRCFSVCFCFSGLVRGPLCFFTT